MPFRFGSFDIGRIRGKVQAFGTNSQHVVGGIIEGDVLHFPHMFEHSQSILCPQRDLVKLLRQQGTH